MKKYNLTWRTAKKKTKKITLKDVEALFSAKADLKYPF